MKDLSLLTDYLIISFIAFGGGMFVGSSLYRLSNNGAQHKQADYAIITTQTSVQIRNNNTGETKIVSHKELNDYFINDNL